MKNNFLEVTVVAFVLLTAILNIFLVLFVYYDLSDSIIAGIIGFFGAIIGGYITLRGVRHTITSNMDIEFKRQIPNKVQSIYIIKNELNGIITKLTVNDNRIKFTKPYALFVSIEKCYKDKELIKESLAISPETYRKVNALWSYINIQYNLYSQGFYNDDKEEGYEKRDIDRIEYFLNSCSSETLKCIHHLDKESEELLAKYYWKYI